MARLGSESSFIEGGVRMPRKLALKRLTTSDLTLFKSHFRNHPSSKQKAFNLDSRVMTGKLFPRLRELAPIPPHRHTVDLRMYGPGGAPAYSLARKILKQQKNWRLNGELIDDPDGRPGLYDALNEGDYAILEFEGDDAPSGVKIVLVAKDVPADARIHAELYDRFPVGSMWAISVDTIQEVVAAASPAAGHPLNDWVDGDTIEDAVLGGAEGAAAISKRRGARGMSPEDFIRALRRAEVTGLVGEELLNAWLDERQSIAEIDSFEWVSSSNAISPYDFLVSPKAGQIRLIDAKSSSGAFGNPIHLSFRELQTAVEGKDPYDIYRLYEVSEAGGKMRIAADVRQSLEPVLAALRILPHGVSVDSISIRPENLVFSGEVLVLSAADDGLVE